MPQWKTPPPCTTPRAGTGSTRRTGPRPSRHQAVPAPDHGFDGVGATRIRQLLPQLGDGHPDGVRKGVDVLIPDVIEEALCGQDLPGVKHEVPEKGEFP